jgi:hypothetical protein
MNLNNLYIFKLHPSDLRYFLFKLFSLAFRKNIAFLIFDALTLQSHMSKTRSTALVLQAIATPAVINSHQAAALNHRSIQK